QSLQVHTHGKIAAGRILLVGGGARKEFQASDLRGFAARAVKAGSSASAKHVSVVLPYGEGAVQERAAQFLAEGALLGRYKFDKYLTGEKKAKETLEEVAIAMSAD